MKKNSLLILLSLLMACSSSNKDYSKIEVTSSLFDFIKLSQSKEVVKAFLGTPEKSYIIKSVGKSDEDIWIYSHNENHGQRAAITFDIKTGTVVGKTFIPSENEHEQTLEFVLNKKFSGLIFEEIRLKKCLDFTPSQSFYFNVEKGIQIEYNRLDKAVESVTWTSSEKVKDRIQQIKTCQQHDIELIEQN